MCATLFAPTVARHIDDRHRNLHAAGHAQR
jgi:hypothetical protein